MQTIPPVGATERQVHRAVIDLIEGRSNGNGVVTLSAGQATTTVTKQTINANAVVLLQPVTANAAASAASTYVTVNPAGGAFTLNHANNGQTDRTFRYMVIGG